MRATRRATGAKGGPRSVSSAGKRRSRSAPGGFVDARELQGEDLIAKTLGETTNMLGVAARPKVVDFNARLKEHKHARRMVVVRKALVSVVALAGVAALAWFLFFSPVFLLDGNQIEVSGQNKWVGRQQIVSIARKQSGKSLFLVSSSEVTKQLTAIPGVSQAKVKKEFPQGLGVSVVAQEPAAMLRTRNGNMVAVDGQGRVLNSVGNVSAQGIPVIEVKRVGSGLSSRAVQQAVRVLNQMPAQMRHSVTKVEAKTQDSVTTELNGGDRVIIWGDSSQMKLKKAVVDKIGNDPSKIGDKHQIDVSAPLHPIIK
ncbi:FtsQ-type POTRA domain-containing protein [Bifidobacterium sp. ESL0763]|uniref:cell division protein FtsQ/DivIB n=1 Tax=Bifidobacterium sp. ESL0763 TaxID=2983227 RepID=UPI0023FA4657|nr:FtsQ-type POTRA domain-containing protein [Bifidobacterium sp. ESL0763]MDF7664146.1 FtsQ-type POTRA domain-containing protein [Bifidobacterium sp. ESL0763]